MQYKGIKFDAVVATPGCGKSYLSDNYPDIFADMDEIRLRCKYEVPEGTTREELENTKGERKFKKKKYTFEDMYKEYDKCLEKGMILIAAPHPEAFDYLDSRKIKFCFVYPDKNAKEKLKKRFESRNNPTSFIKENDDMFDEFYISNRNDKRAAVHYEFSGDEYLSDILRKFGLDF